LKEIFTFQFDTFDTRERDRRHRRSWCFMDFIPLPQRCLVKFIWIWTFPSWVHLGSLHDLDSCHETLMTQSKIVLLAYKFLLVGQNPFELTSQATGAFIISRNAHGLDVDTDVVECALDIKQDRIYPGPLFGPGSEVFGNFFRCI
jgi:hypothetical protein